MEKNFNELAVDLSNLIKKMEDACRAEWEEYISSLLVDTGRDLTDPDEMSEASQEILTKIRLEAAEHMRRNKGGWTGGYGFQIRESARPNNIEEGIQFGVADNMFGSPDLAIYRASKKLRDAKKGKKRFMSERAKKMREES